ncbi:hypothetical protein [Hydrogenophaga sp. 5NK40-0174]|uniref:hypothetical protein n=1 Tax=Hydrogenophaga sp. 5NK40-0174 TaxID=3127649 RepID=UPI003341DBBE
MPIPMPTSFRLDQRRRPPGGGSSRTVVHKRLLLQMRILGPALMLQVRDPHAEWLTLFWSNRFDRDHALTLLDHQDQGTQGFWLRHVQQAAKAFDALERPVQQRVRQIVLRHRRRFPARLAAMSE